MGTEHTTLELAFVRPSPETKRLVADILRDLAPSNINQYKRDYGVPSVISGIDAAADTILKVFDELYVEYSSVPNKSWRSISFEIEKNARRQSLDICVVLEGDNPADGRVLRCIPAARIDDQRFAIWI